MRTLKAALNPLPCNAAFGALTALMMVGTLGLGMSACDRVSPDAPMLSVYQGAIQGGETDETTKAVVGIALLTGQGFGSCSGTLITPNIVLTAQHCVAPITGTGGGQVDCNVSNFGAPYKDLFVTTETQIGFDIDLYVKGALVLTPPGSGVCGRDVALIILESPISADVTEPMVPRVDEPVEAPGLATPNMGEVYSAVGYGATSGQGGGSGMRRRRDGLRASCNGVGCGALGFLTATEWMGEAGVCQGDSGGPAIDTKNRVIGVVSRGGANCSFPVYGGVYTWRDWITEAVIAQSTATGQPIPGWAEGEPTDPAYAYPVGAACADATDCDSGACQFGYCTRLCKESAPCPDGYTCGATTGYCIHAPVGGDCTVDADCPGGSCLDGTCTRACLETVPCPDGTSCAGGVCAPAPVGGLCGGDDECDGICVDGLCTRSCAEFGCPAPFVCTDSACASPEMGGECVDDAGCASGICVDGLCTRPCVEAPCADGWVCDVDADQCTPVPECLGDDCGTRDSGCQGGAGGGQGPVLPIIATLLMLLAVRRRQGARQAG